MDRRWIGFAVAALLAGGNLSGCQPLAAAPLPTPQAIRVQISPSLRPWTEDLHACASGLAGAGLVLDEIPASGMDPLQADLSLRLGGSVGENIYAAAIGEEEIVMVVHPSNPMDELAFADLQGMYAGSVGSWEEISGSPASLAGQPIQIWSYLPGEDTRSGFDAAVLSGRDTAPVVNLAPSPKAMLEAVAGSPSAIGFVPGRWVDETVRPVAVDLPGEALREPVLALSAKEPQGQPRQLLLCLQKSR